MAIGPNVWCIGSSSCEASDAMAPPSDSCKGVTDDAYEFAAKQQAAATCTLGAVDLAIQLTLAIWQRTTTGDIADMQEEIADEQMLMAEALHEHAKKFWAAELGIVNDAFGMAREATDYSGLSAGWKAFTTATFTAGRAEWLRALSRSCDVPTACEEARWQRMQKLMESDALSFASRQAEARAQIQRDQRYERQYAALGMSHGVLGNTIQWQSAALAIGASGQNALMGSVNSLVRETGYWMQYRQPSMWSHLSSASQLGRSHYLPAPPVVMRAATTHAAPSDVRIAVEALPATQGKAGGLMGEGYGEASAAWKTEYGRAPGE